MCELKAIISSLSFKGTATVSEKKGRQNDDEVDSNNNQKGRSENLREGQIQSQDQENPGSLGLDLDNEVSKTKVE